MTHLYGVPPDPAWWKYRRCADRLCAPAERRRQCGAMPDPQKWAANDL